jgi:hypothetical protein
VLRDGRERFVDRLYDLEVGTHVSFEYMTECIALRRVRLNREHSIFGACFDARRPQFQDRIHRFQLTLSI